MHRATVPPETAAKWSAACRPTLLFVPAYALTITLHEAAHAAAGYLLGFRSTLFHLWVDPDTSRSTPGLQALIVAAGPAFSLCLGALCWFVYSRCKQRPSGLLFLMLGINGIYLFLGNLFAAALGGDVNHLMALVGAPRAVPYALSATGLVLLSIFMFFRGRDLLRWAPAGLGRYGAVVCMTVAPWILGSGLALLIYLPLPPALIGPTLVGSVFWCFTVAGAILSKAEPRSPAIASFIGASDLVFTGAAVLIVRILASGVELVP